MKIKTRVKKQTTTTISVDLDDEGALDLMLEALKAKGMIPHTVRSHQAELVTDMHGTISGIDITVVEETS